MNSIDLQVSLFQDYLKPIRLCAGWSQHDMAKIINVSNQTIGFLEIKRREMTVERYYAFRFLIDQKNDPLLNNLVNFFVIDDSVSKKSKDELALTIVGYYNSQFKGNGAQYLCDVIRQRISTRGTLNGYKL